MRKKIYIQEWLLFKPYDKQTVTDSYYLKLCNEVKQAFEEGEDFHVLEEYLGDNNIDYLACFLTSYFEDIISETNFWNSFVRVHKRLYNKQLPFYILNEYYEGEINIQDVCFLIWYYLNTIQEKKFISPFNDFIIHSATHVMAIFEEEWENAPENKTLKLNYQIDETESDFYTARILIDKILFESYLFSTDTLLKLKERELEIIHENRDDKNLIMYLNENRDKTLHDSHTHLLGLSGKEWASEIIGRDHPLSNDFLNISQKIIGYFFYKGQDESDVFLEHIASSKKFKLTKKSYDHSNNLKEIDTILFMGIVQWRGEWWFSGIQTQHLFNADLILNEKNSIESRANVNFLDHQKKDVGEMLEKHFKAFKDYNDGSQIAFMKSDTIDDFIRGYSNFYNASLNLSEEEISKAKERTRKDGFFDLEYSSENFTEKSYTALVFFNPKSGCEIALEVSSAFPLNNNPFFEKELSDEHIMRLLMDESISPDLVMFCIKNCKDKLPFFKIGIGKKYLKDIDFLLRFWKRKNYHAKPTITFTGNQENNE